MSTVDLDALAASLRAAARAYYDTDQVVMSDAEYDDGIEQLRIAVAQDPALAPRFADLLEVVAAGQSAGGDVQHTSLMGSMAKVVGLDAVAAFVDELGGAVVVEPKLDGLALTVTYRDGALVLAATRGDGRSGEDITDRVRTLAVQGLPARLAGTDLSVEVRGEVVVTDRDFERANVLRTGVSATSSPFINPRNAAAGIVRKGDAAYAGVLTFAAYEVVPARAQDASGATSDGARGATSDGARGATRDAEPSVTSDAAPGAASDVVREPEPDRPEATHVGRLAAIALAGVGTVRELVPGLPGVPTSDTDEVLTRVTFLGERRTTLGFPIDGAIVKADRDADRDRLGYGSRAPKWAIAYKYDAETATTTVRAITTAVGRTGRLAVRVEVEPVFVGGTTISFATGHNVGWMLERDVRVGDTVVVKRAGDVIPYLEDVVLDARPADSQPWVPPATDPMGKPWDTSTLLWRSTSPELSVLGKIVYAASRDCFDIEGMGTEVATALVEGGFVSSIADLFDLDLETLTSLDLGGRALGAANGRKVHAEIRRALDTPWNRVITALGIRATGRTMGRRLAVAFPTMDRLRAASREDLAAVGGIGEIKAELMYAGLRELEASGVLDRLASAGLAMGTEPEPGPDGDGAVDLRPLAGLTVVVSGAVPGLTRGEVAEVIEAAGGKASSSVSASTSLLVSDPSTSSKYVKATTLGVRIVTPAEFLLLVGRQP